MPGPFSWTHSLSCKSLCNKPEADVLIDVDSWDSCSTKSFSSPIASSKADMLMSSKSSRSRGCSPQITKLHEPEVNMIHGSSKILIKQSSSTSPAPASCNNNNNNNSSARKSADYIHQSQTGDYYYKASPLKVQRVCKPARNSGHKHNKIAQTTVGGFMGCSDLGPADNMCLVKGCCECNIVQTACESSNFQDVADHAVDHGVGGASHNSSRSSSSPTCICPKCDEAFYKAEALELHKISRHAVSQLKDGNSSLNVVEIIFKTSWQLQTTRDQSTPAAALGPKIKRILKIENTETTIKEFEEYRNKVKSKRNRIAHAGGRIRSRATSHDDDDDHNNNNNKSAGSCMIKKKISLQRQATDQRCVADGNELLRFFATSLSCDLGNNGCTNLCGMQTCNVCNIIRWGFVNERGKGIYTTATSGKAHEEFILKQEKELQQQQQQKTSSSNSSSKLEGKKTKSKKKKKQEDEEQHAMFVCRVIAGRIQKFGTDQVLPALPAFSLLPQGYDSVAQDLSSGPAPAGAHGSSTTCAHLDDLFVFDSKALLPCFVVVYTI